MTIKKEIANVFVRMFFVIAMLTTIWALPYSTDSDQTVSNRLFRASNI